MIELDNTQLSEQGEPWQTREEENGLTSQFVSPTKRCWCGGSVGTRSPGDTNGLGCLLNITHVWDFTDSQVDNLLAELEATPEVAYSTHDELLTALDELLDSALHSEECYIDPDDTHCTCVIGKVRAVLPRCEELQVVEDAVGTKVWRCHRSAHPASPDRHTFGGA